VWRLMPSATTSNQVESDPTQEQRQNAAHTAKEPAQRVEPLAKTDAPIVRADAPLQTKIETGASVADADLQLKTKEQLIADVVKLRDEREVLLKQRAELEKLKPSPMQQMEQTMFRDSPEMLTQYAKNGTLKIRTPLLADHDWELGSEGKNESLLTDDELAKVTEIYRNSPKRTEARVRKIYIDMGGDVSTANTLAPNALLNEISNKCPKGADDGRSNSGQGARRRHAKWLGRNFARHFGRFSSDDGRGRFAV
jgi:hypothetical protein